MRSPWTFSFTEPITEPEILASIAALPKEEDLPCDDGEPMETPRHRAQMTLLIDSLKAYWAERTDYYVGGNMFLYYDPYQQQRFRGPDFFLVLDVEGEKERERKSWIVWWEGMRFPDLIIELLSDSTREVDKGEKKKLYERVFHTTEYYLYDPFSYEFVGYHLQGGYYQERAPDTEGKIFSPITGLYLVRHEGWLRWMTAEGKLVPTPQELADHERQRAERERQCADQEQQRAEQERQRAEQERQRADQERQRAEHAEQLLEAYRRRFGNLE
jgi:Uma2 family endonuclease